MTPIEQFLIGAFVVYYLTYVFMWEKKTSHWGPFPSKTKKGLYVEEVNGDVEEYYYPITIFDYVRRAMGLYTIVKTEDKSQEIWLVNSARLEVWQCPKCLSFWVGLPIAACFLLFWGNVATIFFPLAWGGTTYLLFWFTEYLRYDFFEPVDVDDDELGELL